MPFLLLVLSALTWGGVAHAFPQGMSAWFVRPVFPVKQTPAPEPPEKTFTQRVGPFDVKVEGSTEKLEVDTLDITSEGLRFGTVRGEAKIRKLSVGTQRMVVDLLVTKIDGGIGIKTIDNFQASIVSRRPIAISLPTEIHLMVDPAEGGKVSFTDGAALLNHFETQLNDVFSETGFPHYFHEVKTNSTGLEKDVMDWVLGNARKQFIQALRDTVVREIHRPAFLAQLEREIGKSIRCLNIPWDGPTEIALERAWLPVAQITQTPGTYGAVAAWKLARATKDNPMPDLEMIAPIGSLGRANMITVAASESALEQIMTQAAAKRGLIRRTSGGGGRAEAPKGYIIKASAEESSALHRLFGVSDSRPTDLWADQGDVDAPEVLIDGDPNHGSLRVGMNTAPLFPAPFRGGMRKSAAPPKKLWVDFTLEPGMKIDVAQVRNGEGETMEAGGGLFSRLASGVQEKLLVGLLREELARAREWKSPTEIGVVRPFDMRALGGSDDREGFLLVDLRVDAN